MADYKTPQWLLPNEKNLAYPAAGDGITGSGLSEDRHSLYSMDFDGTTNQNINLPTNWVTSLGLSTEMSFSVWVKPDSTSTQMNITSSPYNTWNDNFGIKYIAGSTTLTLEQGSTVKFTNTSTTLSTTSYTSFYSKNYFVCTCYIKTISISASSWAVLTNYSSILRV